MLQNGIGGRCPRVRVGVVEESRERGKGRVAADLGQRLACLDLLLTVSPHREIGQLGR